MELLHGTTLAEKLEVTGRIPMQEALPLVTQMASALSAAHDVGIVHLDFKPGNVVLVFWARRPSIGRTLLFHGRRYL
jgi:eukaryotic-like serine/threonine-protein kinase